jgi:AcrR family transcriptional regulator
MAMARTARVTSGRAAEDARKPPGTPPAPAPYHHGSLRQALLRAAEHILEHDGVQGLTLRAAAREAGVSHAAPKNHFGDIKGLLSDLAAVGFERLAGTMRANVNADDEPRARMSALGQGYIAFARANPGLFLLMFRGERLDVTRPALRTAMDAAFGLLSGTVTESENSPGEAKLTLSRAARIAGAWSLVHGLSMLLLDGRLKPLISRLPAGTDDAALVVAIFSASDPDR